MNDKEKMELFERKTPGKWEHFNEYVIIQKHERVKQAICVVGTCKQNEHDSDFIAAASTGWPQDFFGRLVAERETKLLIDWMQRSKNYCPFPEGSMECQGDCDGCVIENIRKLAIISLAAEGIGIEEEE